MDGVMIGLNLEMVVLVKPHSASERVVVVLAGGDEVLLNLTVDGFANIVRAVTRKK
jgi:hypothetical protein